jgi:hypothetical protein
VGEIPLGFRTPLRPGVLASESGEVGSFPPRKRVASTIGLVSDLARQPAIVTSSRQGWPGAFSLAIIVRKTPPPPAIQPVFFEDEPARVTQRFAAIRLE